MKMFTAVQLAKEMKIPPKRIRAILRKAKVEHGGRWKWPVAEKKKIVELVKAGRRTKAKSGAQRRATAPRKRPVEIEHRVH